MVRYAVAALALVLAAGCEMRPKAKQPADDELTIVVEADKSRIAAQEAVLQEQRKTLEEEREHLRAEMEKLGEGGGEKKDSAEAEALLQRAVKLVKEQEELAKRREALASERDGLVRKVTDPAMRGAPAAGGGGGAEVARLTGDLAGREKDVASREKSISDRERAIAERERDLASRESAFAQRDSACLATNKREVDRSPAFSRASVDRAYKALLGQMDRKGVLPSDLPASKQKAFQDAGRLRAANDLERAMQSIEAVEAAVDGLEIGADFVSQKVKRVNVLQQKNANAKTRDQVARLLQEVTRSFSDGRYQDANSSLNSIVHLLE